MPVSHDALKRSIAAAFNQSNVKFSNVSDLSREEFEHLLATAFKACLETAESSQHIRNLK